jgi:preprotein translocase subunit SecD
VVGRADSAEESVEPRQQVLPSMDEEGVFYILEQTPVVTGDDLTDSQPSFDQQTGQPVVTFRFDPTGARAFGEYTAANVGAPFAIVLDNEVISAPVIRQAITGGSGQISGNFTVESSTELAVLLRAGALPAEMTFLEERTIGPELGADSIAAGELAAVVAFAAVLVFMVLSYGLFGVFASVALILNVGLIFGVLSLIGATLTLPGIAGIVLTIGMAVDANVLVFERIREETEDRQGPGPRDRAGLRTGAERHHRRQPDDLHHRGDPVRAGLGPGARVLGDAGDRHPDLGLHRDLRDAPVHRDLVRPASPQDDRGLRCA